MRFELILKADAVNDISEAAMWYEEQQPFLGDEFLLEVENFIETLHLNPYLYQIQKDDLRHGYLSRFPYITVYRIENEKIVIFGFFRSQTNQRFHYPKK